MDNYRTSFITGQTLPLVMEATRSFSFESFLEFLKGERETICKSLLQYGGVLLRGFPIEGSEGFNQSIQALGLGNPIQYIGGDSPRNKVKGKVYTSTEAPANFRILLHNEMSFVRNYPKHIYFFCDIAPKKGGATTLGDARRIHERVDADVRERFNQKGLTYISNFYQRDKLLDTINRYVRSHKTWMDAFETDDKKEVERRCEENGFGYEWREKNWLKVRYEAPATLTHPENGEKVWFNQAHLYDFNMRHMGLGNWLGAKLVYSRKHTIIHEIAYGDSSKIAKKDLYHVMDVLDRETISFPWQKGDLLVLDNVLAMHGRAPFEGPRRILVTMTR